MMGPPEESLWKKVSEVEKMKKGLLPPGTSSKRKRPRDHGTEANELPQQRHGKRRRGVATLLLRPSSPLPATKPPPSSLASSSSSYLSSSSHPTSTSNPAHLVQPQHITLPVTTRMPMAQMPSPHRLCCALHL